MILPKSSTGIKHAYICIAIDGIQNIIDCKHLYLQKIRTPYFCVIFEANVKIQVNKLPSIVFENPRTPSYIVNRVMVDKYVQDFVKFKLDVVVW